MSAAKDSYRASVMSGGRWGSIRSVGLQVLTLITTLVFARLLVPRDFGLVAAVGVVLGMFEMFTRVGLGASLVKRTTVDRHILSTFFWLSAGLGVLVGGIAAAFSGLTARLVGDAEAATLIAVGALTIPINMVATVPNVILLRELRFKTKAIVELVGHIVYGLVAISLAVAGLGAWALIIGQVVSRLVIAGGSSWQSRFRPHLEFDRKLVREELGFNLAWFGADAVSYANKNIDYWGVGNRLGSDALGIYYVAYIIPNLIRQRVTIIGQEVLLPVISQIRDNVARVADAYLRVIGFVSFLVLPAMLGLAVVSDVAVRVGLGAQWEEAAGPMAFISLAAAVTSLTVVARVVFPAFGRPAILVTSGLVGLVVLVAGVMIALGTGSLIAVAIAVLIATVAESVIFQSRIKSLLSLPHRRFMATISPGLISSVVMAASVFLTKEFVEPVVGDWMLALVCVATGVISYFSFGLLAFGSDFRRQISAAREAIGR